MKIYLAEYYENDGEIHTTTVGIFESSELAHAAIQKTLIEKRVVGEDWYKVGDFGVVEYELNQRVWL